MNTSRKIEKRTGITGFVHSEDGRRCTMVAAGRWVYLGAHGWEDCDRDHAGIK